MGKTLVTGVPGWLGNRLVEVLANPENALNKYGPGGQQQVRCLVLPGMDVASIAGSNIEVLRGDITDPSTLAAAVNDVDTVFHLAGIIHPKRVSELYSINRDGLKNVLDAAVSAGVKRLIYISSNSPAGNNISSNRLMKEDDPPHPYKNYGESKLQAEEIALAYHKTGKIEVVVLRPCWFYGPGQPARQNRFFNMIKGGKPLIFGDGNNLRSMSYLDNTVQGLLLAQREAKAAGNIYWIADEQPYVTNDIYNTIAELLNVKLRPVHLPRIVSQCCELADTIIQATGFYSTDFHVAGEMVYDIACDIEKAKRELGYKPEIALREGMRRSIEWCRQNGVNI